MKIYFQRKIYSFIMYTYLVVCSICSYQRGYFEIHPFLGIAEVFIEMVLLLVNEGQNLEAKFINIGP